MRPLPSRLTLVLSRHEINLAGVIRAATLDDALFRARAAAHVERLFVLGGGKVFALAFSHPNCRSLYITQITQSFRADSFANIPDGPYGALGERLGNRRAPGPVRVERHLPTHDAAEARLRGAERVDYLGNERRRIQIPGLAA